MVALDSLPEMTSEEVLGHADAASLWCIIDDVVYDLTKFAAEHPGGEQVLLEQAGQDASEAFNDVGHSSDAREMAKDYAIGRVKGGERKAKTKPLVPTNNATWAEILTSPTWTNFLIPTAIGIIVYVLYKGTQRFL